jgi:hypothetical protein
MQVVHKLTGGKRTSASVKKVKLDKLWKHEHDVAFQASMDQLIAAVTLAHPKDGYTTPKFTDASKTHWSSVLTQIPDRANRLPLRDQRHEPLAFLSGEFKDSSCSWSTVEDEAYLIVCGHLSVLIIC